MSFRVGVNAVFLEPGMGGIETYLLRLIPALLDEDPSLSITILANRHGRELLARQPWASDVRLETPAATRRGMRALYELGPLGWTAGRRFDVLHSPALTAPLFTRAANVVTVADTTWITMPDMGKGQAATVRLWQAVVPVVARRADRVLVHSTAAAEDVAAHLRVLPERIDVVPHGHDPSRRADPTPAPELRERLGLGAGPLLLNVGVKKAHKNQMRLVEALPMVRREIAGARLVLAGTTTPYASGLAARARELGVHDSLALLDYVDDRDLEGLYAAASVFLFPSLNEGFGLPVLEAMARGLPVVTSNRSSLPEVAGDAAILVDPTSVEGIAAAATSVLEDDALRDRLISAGTRRIGCFTWQRAAQLTLDSWRRAAAAGSGR